MSQPPLSQRLKEMEEELGVTLINRGGHNWAVTTEGKALYRRALEILDLVEDIPTEIMRHQGEAEGLATIGCTTLSMAFLKRFIPEFHRRHPKVKLRMVVDDSTVLEQRLRAHTFDFCIMLPPISTTGLELIALPVSSACAVIAPSLVSKAVEKAAEINTFLPLSALDGQPIAIFRRYEGGGLHQQALRVLADHGVKPNIILDCHDCAFMLNLLQEGLEAMVIVPYSEVPQHIMEQFTVCFLPDCIPMVKPHIARIEGRYLPRAARLAFDELQAFASDSPDFS